MLVASCSLNLDRNPALGTKDWPIDFGNYLTVVESGGLKRDGNKVLVEEARNMTGYQIYLTTQNLTS